MTDFKDDDIIWLIKNGATVSYEFESKMNHVCFYKGQFILNDDIIDESELKEIILNFDRNINEYLNNLNSSIFTAVNSI